jgi:hypothetical protein
MHVGAFDTEDIDTLAEILERERKSHCRKCSIFLVMFVIAFVSLVVALALVGVNLAGVIGSPGGARAMADQFPVFQVVAPLTAVALSFFGGWWATQNCIHSIERTLFAARNRRMKLFETFLGQIQCSGKDKQRAWLEILKAAVM